MSRLWSKFVTLRRFSLFLPSLYLSPPPSPLSLPQPWSGRSPSTLPVMTSILLSRDSRPEFSDDCSTATTKCCSNNAYATATTNMKRWQQRLCNSKLCTTNLEATATASYATNHRRIESKNQNINTTTSIDSAYISKNVWECSKKRDYKQFAVANSHVDVEKLFIHVHACVSELIIFFVSRLTCT